MPVQGPGVKLDAPFGLEPPDIPATRCSTATHILPLSAPNLQVFFPLLQPDMLSIFLCTGRSGHNDLDYSAFSLDGEAPRKKPSFSSRKGSKISKLQIGAPSDFRHESHMGYDEVAGFDIDGYQQRMQMNLAQQPQQQSPSPTSQSFSQNLNRSPSAARSPVKRKPAPVALPIEEEISMKTPTRGNGSPAIRGSGSPTESKYGRTSPPQSPARSTYSASQPPSLSISKKALVPLFGEGSSSNAPYVTETAKIRYDGAMAEIERALKESR
ncbi:hypothetical protein FRB90_002711 [Tulasnella sp. 427]|nr:hypothetical protein FRB90_002711 [Tulasnella sp. 427]